MERILESLVAAGIGLAVATLLGFVVAGFHSPIALAAVTVLSGLGWAYRQELAWMPASGWALLAILAIAGSLFLVSPSYIGRFLESVF